MVELLVRAFEARGVQISPLLDELAIDQGQQWVPWSAVCELTERAGTQAGGPDQLREVGRVMPELALSGPRRRLLALALSPRQLYRLLWRWQGPTSFTPVRTGFQEEEGALELHAWLVPDARGCEAFFHIIWGSLETSPAVLGLPPAVVEADIDSRRARYRVLPPPSSSFITRLVRAARLFRATGDAIDELAAQHQALRESREARRESEERFRRLAESTHDMIAEWTDGGTCVYVSPNVETLLGYSQQEFMADPARLLHPDERDRVRDALARRSAQGGSGATTFRLRHRDGRWLWFDNTSNVVRLPGGGQRVVTVTREVTDRRQLETRVRQSQKMEALARLAGGIAHDFNNLLTVIKGWCDLLTEDADSEARQQIAEAADRAAVLTRRLLAVSRRQPVAPRIVRLEECVAEVERLAGPGVADRIEVALRFGPDVPPVRVDPEQVDQVVLNLMDNAREAMPRGGRLTVEVERRDLPPDNPSGLPPGTYAALVVRDEGIGMDAETRARAFDPFFTTKQPGPGSGLGLAVVHGIAHQNGGSVDLRSTPGKGTTVTVLLPPAEADEVAEETGHYEPEGSPLGSETVLVVEDEEGVREVARRALERHGYRVLVAEDADQALEVLSGWGRQVDLVITDLLMPRRSGLELAHAAARDHPHLAFLYMTGHSGSPTVDHPVLDADSLLLKPFSPSELARRVRQRLDRT